MTPAVLLDLPGPEQPLRVEGNFFLEIFAGVACFTLAVLCRAIPALRPWDCRYGEQLDVLKYGAILLRLAESGRLVVGHLGTPCQSLTWARTPALRTRYFIWGLPWLGVAAKNKISIANSLFIFSIQFCTCMVTSGAYFSLENPLRSCCGPSLSLPAFMSGLGLQLYGSTTTSSGRLTPSRHCSCITCRPCTI